MRILITGANGQLGSDCLSILSQNAENDVIGVTRQDFDLTNYTATFNYISGMKLDVIVHCAAYTNVDKAEIYPEQCFAVNVTGTKAIVDACKESGTKLIFISSDFVYNTNNRLIPEDELLSPANVYGKSKMIAEQYIQENIDNYFILRTSWLYGKTGSNFIKTMIRLADEGVNQLKVVNDQISSPTSTIDLSNLIEKLITSEKYGVYNTINSGYVSKFDLACKIFETLNKHVYVIPITTEAYNLEHPLSAPRPLSSMLDISKLTNTFGSLPAWEDSLTKFLL